MIARESVTEIEIGQRIAVLFSQFSSATSSGSTTQNDLMKNLAGQDLGLWNEMIDNPKMLQSQYDVVAIEGGANKDLAKFADQINALCDKWE